MTAPVRLVAKLVATPFARKTRHFTGPPPQIVEGQEQNLMPVAQVLIIQPEEDGFLLIRYAANGEFGGYTWHETMTQAQEQAEYEFGPSLSSWLQVPSEIQDPVAFAFQRKP